MKQGQPHAERESHLEFRSRQTDLASDGGKSNSESTGEKRRENGRTGHTQNYKPRTKRWSGCECCQHRDEEKVGRLEEKIVYAKYLS
jgi:hypothetical protein